MPSLNIKGQRRRAMHPWHSKAYCQELKCDGAPPTSSKSAASLCVVERMILTTWFIQDISSTNIQTSAHHTPHAPRGENAAAPCSACKSQHGLHTQKLPSHTTTAGGVGRTVYGSSKGASSWCTGVGNSGCASRGGKCCNSIYSAFSASLRAEYTTASSAGFHSM